MGKYTIYILNILLVALPLAIFEIVIEKDKGWGSGWAKDRWYSKQFLPNNKLFKGISVVLGIQGILTYHFLVFGMLIPVILAWEYFVLNSNLILMLASYVIILVSEDFFWFALNWHFSSFRHLLKGPKGEIWWHKKWINIKGDFYLPSSYFSSTILSLVLLFLA